MLNKFINFKAIRKDMRQVGILAILAGLISYFLPDGSGNETHVRDGVYFMLAFGFVIWCIGVSRKWPLGIKALWARLTRGKKNPQYKGVRAEIHSGQLMQQVASYV